VYDSWMCEAAYDKVIEMLTITKDAYEICFFLLDRRFEHV